MVENIFITSTYGGKGIPSEMEVHYIIHSAVSRIGYRWVLIIIQQRYRFLYSLHIFINSWSDLEWGIKIEQFDFRAVNVRNDDDENNNNDDDDNDNDDDNNEYDLLVAVQAMTSHTADEIVLSLLVKRDSDRSVLPLVRLHKASAVVKVFLALHLHHIVTTTTPVEGDLLSNLGTLPLGLGVELPLDIHKALCDGDKDGKK